MYNQLAPTDQNVPRGQLWLRAIDKQGDKLQFFAEQGDADAIRRRVAIVGSTIGLHEPSRPFVPPPEDSLHETVVGFITFVAWLAANDRRPEVHGAEAASIAEKAREHFTYLVEKCDEWGSSPPHDWKDGILVRGRPASLPGAFRWPWHQQASPRTMKAADVLTAAVGELIDHFFVLCTREISSGPHRTDGGPQIEATPHGTDSLRAAREAGLLAHETEIRGREEAAATRLHEREQDIQRRQGELEQKLVRYEADIQLREQQLVSRFIEFERSVSGRMDAYARHLKATEVAWLRRQMGIDKDIQPLGAPDTGEPSAKTDTTSGVESWFLPNPEPRASAPVDVRRLPKASSSTGELPGFVAEIESHGRFRDGDTVVYRLPLDVETMWDEDFATVIAATVSIDTQEAVAEIRLGLGDDAGLAYERICEPEGDAYFTTGGWRFTQPPKCPYLQVKLLLRATQSRLRVTVTKLFAGNDFDPYLLNPRYEAAARTAGRPSFQDGDKVLRDFERKAREACRTDSYVAAQAFVRPFLVMREGDPRFPMLIGSVNSVYWYGLAPQHGLESFRELGCPGDGDVTLDCGAHAGQMAAYFALKAGPRGRVLAFDPFAQNCLQVEAQDQLNAGGRIRAIKAGVGARHQTLRVSILAQMTTSTDALTPADHTEITIIPLDDYIDQQPTFLKLDVEGAEVDALIGAAKLLRLCRPKIFVEVHTQLIGKFGYNLTDFFSQIPTDLYDIKFIVEGVDSAWRPYEAGLEAGVTAPLLVFATPKQPKGGGLLP